MFVREDFKKNLKKCYSDFEQYIFHNSPYTFQYNEFAKQTKKYNNNKININLLVR